MKARAVILTVAVCLAAVAVCRATDLSTGTWKLNEAKSHLNAGAPKYSTVVFEPVGDSVKITIDGTNAAGNPAHNEWTGKFDGKDYPVTGDPSTDTRSLRQINSRTLALRVIKDGKVTVTGRVVLSRDGKSRVVYTTVTDAQGHKVKSMAYYDKE